MSQENVEIIREGYEHFSRTGGWLRDRFDPEIEVWESPGLPGDLAGKGYDNLARANDVLLESSAEWSIEPERFFDLGERILVFVRGGSPSDAGPTVSRMLGDRFQPMAALAGDARMAVDTQATLALQVDAVEAWLDARLAEGTGL